MRRLLSLFSLCGILVLGDREREGYRKIRDVMIVISVFAGGGRVMVSRAVRGCVVLVGGHCDITLRR